MRKVYFNLKWKWREGRYVGSDNIWQSVSKQNETSIRREPTERIRNVVMGTSTNYIYWHYLCYSLFRFITKRNNNHGKIESVYEPPRFLSSRLCDMCCWSSYINNATYFLFSLISIYFIFNSEGTMSLSSFFVILSSRLFEWYKWWNKVS